MKPLQLIVMMGGLAIAGAAYAQTTPVPGQPQTVPTSPIPATPTTPETDKKSEFNAPQSPARPAQIPSEDTLIKGQKSSAAVIMDSLTPSSDKKADRMNRRKNKKGTAETDDSTSSKTETDRIRKPR